MVDKKRINRHERDLARKLGGQTVPSSGATDFHKGDIKVGRFLIDDKSTETKSIKVTKDMLIKINKEARESGREPCLSLSFLSEMGLAGKTWFLVPKWVFEELMSDNV